MALERIKLDGSEDGGTAAVKINAVMDVVDQNELDVAMLLNPDSTMYNPITGLPHTEGRLYYDSAKHALTYQTDIDGVDINVNMENVRRCFNGTGATIPDGTPCRQIGSDDNTGVVLITPALADDFTNGVVLVLVTHDILDQTEGWGTYSGDIDDLNLASLAETGQTLLKGLPIYLSAIEAGKYTMVAPDVATQIGGFLTGVQNVSEGNFAVSIRSLINLPVIDATFQNTSTPINIGVTPLEFDNFLETDNLIIDVSSGNSFLIPIIGKYEGSFVVSMDNINANANGHTIGIEIFNKTSATSLFIYQMSVGRNDTLASDSFTAPITLEEGDDIVMRYNQISGNNIGDAINISGISIDIKSRRLRNV